METAKNAANYISESVHGTGASASKEANKNVAKDSDASLGSRATAAKDTVVDKKNEKSHDVRADANKVMAFNMNPANFANRPHELIKDIARKGSESSHASGFAHTDESEQKALQRDIASKDGHSSGGSFGPGDPHAREASHQSGQTSGGSFEPEDPRAQEAGKKGGSSGQHEE